MTETKKPMDVARASRLLAAARSYVVMRDMLHGGALMLMESRYGVPGEDGFPSFCETAATDGGTLFFNFEFAIELGAVDEVAAVLAHEACHKNCLHPWRRGDRHPVLWNVAADHVVNLIVEEMGYKLPKWAIKDGKYAGWSVEAVYSDLLSRLRGRGLGPGPVNVGNGGGKGKGKGTGDGEGLDGKARQALGVPDDWKPDVVDAPVMSSDDEEAIKAELQQVQAASIQAATIAEKRMGSLPAGMRTVIEQIAMPQLDWRALVHQYLTELVQNDYSWSRISRSYLASTEGTVAAPSSWSEAMGTLLCVRDTSGSVGAEAFAQFNGELTALFKASEFQRLVILDCDAAVHEVLDTDKEPFVSVPTERRGGGGTSFRPPFEWLEEQGIAPDLLVYLTDCYGRYPDEAPAYPVIWVCEGEGYRDERYAPPFGDLATISA